MKRKSETETSSRSHPGYCTCPALCYTGDREVTSCAVTYSLTR
jgi:hypothetical protein